MKIQTLLALTMICTMGAHAQPVLPTGGPMPEEWIDADTRHRVVRLTRLEGKTSGFYFHNNPFYGNKMLFYNSQPGKGRQMYSVDLKTFKTEQVTSQASPMGGEIIGQKSGYAYYQVKDSVFRTHVDKKKTELLFVFPSDYRGSITTLNADETLLAGAKASDQQKEILKQYPEKSQYFNRIFDAHLPNDLFVINIKEKKLEKLHTENNWLGHVQFSPTDPKLLMFCHEGPWHKVDRIWTINTSTKEIKKMHSRTMDMEIAGHEWFSADGKTIWYDLQQPRSVTFFVSGTDVQTGREKKYELQRDEWSIHFNSTKDNSLFCGDGGNDTQVAKAKDGMWIYLFKPHGEKFQAERLVNMKNHNYRLEPNVHFSPDGKWVIFKANFEGREEVYAASIEKQP